MLSDLPSVLQLLHRHPQVILAGGTDFYPALQDRAAPTELIDVTAIDELRGILPDDAGGWRIGAAVTWSDLLRCELPAGFNGLKAAAREVGSVQIQNAATLVGNLCTASPAADGVPALLTLDAHVEIASITGIRTLALDEFILGPRSIALAADELVTALLIPALAEGAVGGFTKLGARRYLIISMAMVAVRLDTDTNGRLLAARIAVGACSPVARRLPELEANLCRLPLAGVPAAERRPLVRACIEAESLHALAPINDIRASAHYRLAAVAELLERLINATLNCR